MVESIILELIDDYHNEIKKFMDLFEKIYGRRDILRAWKEKLIEQNGNLTDTVSYELHGIGCNIINLENNINVNFDFGPDFRIDGIDFWNLKRYLKYRLDLNDKIKEGDLKLSFDKLIENHYIEKTFPDSNLYFFTHK